MRNLPAKSINKALGARTLVEDMRVNTYIHTYTYIRFILTMMESSSGGGYSCTSPHITHHIAGTMATAV